MVRKTIFFLNIKMASLVSHIIQIFVDLKGASWNAYHFKQDPKFNITIIA